MISKELELEHKRLHRRLTALAELAAELLQRPALPSNPFNWTGTNYEELQALAAMLGETASEVAYSSLKVRLARGD